MYLPSQFAEPRIEELHRIVRETSLGMMVRNTSDGMEADHLPFLLDADPGEHGTLIGHVARSNPVWREIEDGAKVLVVFRGLRLWPTIPNTGTRSHQAWNKPIDACRRPTVPCISVIIGLPAAFA
jgi:hypothetical protein